MRGSAKSGSSSPIVTMRLKSTAESGRTAAWARPESLFSSLSSPLSVGCPPVNMNGTSIGKGRYVPGSMRARYMPGADWSSKMVATLATAK